MSSLTTSTAEWLTSVSTQLRDRLAVVDVPMLSAAESKALLAGFIDLARLADAGAVLIANTVAEAHPVGVGAATTELARTAGVSKAEAERIVATSKALPKLDHTRAALVSGRLSRSQVGVVAEAAAGAPGFEEALLETARFQDLVGLLRHAERIKASCGNEEARRKKAHATRSWRTWIRDGQWHAHITGPIAEGAEIEQNHRPFRDQALDTARKNGSTESPWV